MVPVSQLPQMSGNAVPSEWTNKHIRLESFQRRDFLTQ